MGRDRKEYKRIQIKLTKWINDDLEQYIMKYNETNKDKINKTIIIEQAICEFLDKYKNF